MSNQHLTDQTFAGLDLPAVLQQGIEAAGFTHCTEIQARTLPLTLAGADVAGQAQTGTGKSAAFLLTVYTRLLRDPGAPDRKPTQPRALILAPTRELAIQIHKDAEVLGRFTGLRLGLIYGGTGYDSQRSLLESGVDILIGTPGRIIDFFKQGLFDLKALQVFVLDEADRMFDLGFIKDVRYLMRRMPPVDQRQSLMFSATLSYRVTELAYEHMNMPQQVKVNADQVTVERVRELVYYPSNEEKIPLLLGLLRKQGAARSMVFVNTKHVAEKLWAWLEGNGHKVAVLSGDVPQPKRERLLAAFREGELDILVATDVAARGLHIPDVSHVYNYDLPQDAEDYVHRIGRTARAGASGDAISFACEDYAYSLIDIQEYIGHEIPTSRVDPDLIVKPAPPVPYERSPRRGRPGNSGGGRRPERGGGRGGRDRSGAPSGGRRSQGSGPGARTGRDSRPAAAAGQAPIPAAIASAEPAPAAPQREAAKPVSAPRPRGPETPAIG